MARPKGYDRDAVLVAARDLFWEQGYERASIADLEKRTGLNRSSIYQEFGSKRELFSAALQCYADRVIAEIDPGPVEARARLLASALMGIWLSVRIDPADASALCQTIADQVEAWRIR